MESPKKFIESLKQINISIGDKLGRDRALLYTLNLLKKNKIETLFPEICVASCKLFPTFFSLKGDFSGYPDGRKVRDAIWHLEDEKKAWVRGNMKSGYILTEKGKDIFENEVMEMMSGLSEQKYESKFYSTGSDKPEYFITKCIDTDVFKKFLNGKNEEIKEYEVRYLLRGTRTTNIKILHDNLHKYMKYYNRLSFEDMKGNMKGNLSPEKWKALGEMLEYLEKGFNKIITK